MPAGQRLLETEKLPEEIRGGGDADGVLEFPIQDQVPVKLHDGALEGRTQPVVNRGRQLCLVFDLGEAGLDLAEGEPPPPAGNEFQGGQDLPRPVGVLILSVSSVWPRRLRRSLLSMTKIL